MSQLLWRIALGLVEASRGNYAEGESLLRDAIALQSGEQPETEARTLLALADVLEGAGRNREAAAAVEDAVALFERKGFLAGVALARGRLAQLTA